MASPEKACGGSVGSEGQQPFEWFGDLNPVEFEIEFLERIRQRGPNDITVLRRLAELLSRQGLYHRSVEVDRHLVMLRPDDGVARYNLACSLARQGAAQQAIDQLKQAIEHGYNDLGHMEVDPDLESLRNDPEYCGLLERHGLRN